jgi:hypothetical protein
MRGQENEHTDRVSMDMAEMANPTVREPWQRRKIRELALFTRRSKPEPSNGANKSRKAPPLVPAPTSIDRAVLDRGLDFVFHKDGMIELTGAGFRCMAQAHFAAIDVVIGVDGREVVRFPAHSRDGITGERD